MVALEKFDKILEHMHTHSDAIYELKDYTGDSIIAKYDTDYESDNGLDIEEADFEEYQCIVMQRIEDGELFEINPHVLPEHIICDGVIIF